MKIAVRCFVYILLIIIVYALPGCSKSGGPIEEVTFTELQVKVISVDNFLLKITTGNKVLTSQLSAPVFEGVKFSIDYFDKKQHVELFDYYRNTVVADTTYTFKPGYVNQLTFFQPSLGAALTLLGPPTNEPPAEKGYGKIAVSYTYAPLPDSLLVVVENSSLNDGVYKATDSFVLKKGQFSKFFESRYTGFRARTKLFTTDASRQQVAEMQSDEFRDMNADYSNYIFRRSKSFGAIAQLAGERLY